MRHPPGPGVIEERQRDRGLGLKRDLRWHPGLLPLRPKRWDERLPLLLADMAALQHLQWFYDNMFSFNTLHSQQPQTLAFALADSPVGLLAWNAQLMGETLDPDFILANVAIYWLTGTSGSSIRRY